MEVSLFQSPGIGFLVISSIIIYARNACYLMPTASFDVYAYYGQYMKITTEFASPRCPPPPLGNLLFACSSMHIDQF